MSGYTEGLGVSLMVGVGHEEFRRGAMVCLKSHSSDSGFLNLSSFHFPLPSQGGERGLNIGKEGV